MNESTNLRDRDEVVGSIRDFRSPRSLPTARPRFSSWNVARSETSIDAIVRVIRSDPAPRVRHACRVGCPLRSHERALDLHAP